MAHAYNPSYSGGRDRNFVVQSQPGQIVLRKAFKKIRLVEWLKVKELSPGQL
jgi:hypothetical protein